jgi:hypothetical protein
MMISKPIQAGLVWAGALIGTAILLKAAQGQHLIGADAVTRVNQAIMGLMIAVYANFMTKQPAKIPPTERGGRLQQARRVSAWAMLVAGLVYAAVSLLAPHPFDLYLAMGAVGTAVVVSIGNAIRTCGGLKAK